MLERVVGSCGGGDVSGAVNLTTLLGAVPAVVVLVMIVEVVVVLVDSHGVVAHKIVTVIIVYISLMEFWSRERL